MNVADPSEYKILKISEEYNVKLMQVSLKIDVFNVFGRPCLCPFFLGLFKFEKLMLHH